MCVLRFDQRDGGCVRIVEVQFDGDGCNAVIELTDENACELEQAVCRVGGGEQVFSKTDECLQMDCVLRMTSAAQSLILQVPLELA